MEAKWLEDFLCLVRTRNFSRAADERNVTQPAFSRRIAALERWLGVSLFDRRTYPITLTPEGRTFRETAENVLGELYRDRSLFSQREHLKRVDITIAAATTLNINFLPDWLKKIELNSGRIYAHIITRSFYDMAQQLTDGDIDLVLQYSCSEVPLLFESTFVESTILSTERMVLISPIDCRTDKVVCDPSSYDRKPMPYMGYSRDGYFADIEKFLFARDPNTASRFVRIGESPTSEIVKRMAKCYGSLALVPESCARHEIDAGEVGIVGGTNWSVELTIQAHRARHCNKAAVQRVWDAAKDLSAR